MYETYHGNMEGCPKEIETLSNKPILSFTFINVGTSLAVFRTTPFWQGMADIIKYMYV